MSDRTVIEATIRRATREVQRGVVALDDRSREALQRLYESASSEIGGLIADAAGNADQVELHRLQTLLAQVDARLRGLSNERDGLLDRSLQSAANLGVSPYESALLSSHTAEKTADAALRFVKSFIAQDGLQLSDRIWRLDRGARDTVVQAIQQAVINGYGAGQAAREFLSRGEPVPLDVQNGLQAARPGKLSREIADQLIAAPGSSLDHAMRLFRTEINRAHGEAYMMGGEGLPDFAGWRFLLSPAHPAPDICDLLSTQNLYGLGPGVYPSRDKCPWPAHPNTLSFVEIVFRDEVTDADRAGIETPIDALSRLSPDQQEGVLGKKKHQVFIDGKMTQGMIRAPWSAVRDRIGGDAQPAPAPKSKPSAVSGPRNDLDTMLRLGREKADQLLKEAEARGNVAAELLQVLHGDLNLSRSTKAAAKIRSKGDGAELIASASRAFPDDWTQAADELGPLYAKAGNGRAYQITLGEQYAGKRLRVKGFGEIRSAGGDGFIKAGSFPSAVHEYAHRLQHALPGLDDYFQELHQRRTVGEPLQPLRDLLPGYGYAIHEVTRKDGYVTPYQGRIYSGSGSRYLGKSGALEVMTIAFEYVLGGSPQHLEKLLEADREMFDLVIGVLYHYVP